MKFQKLHASKRVLIYGLGREGLSTHTFLTKHFPHIKIDIFDDGSPKARHLPWNRYDAIVVSPGVPREKLRGAPAAKITSNTEIFFDNLSESHRRQVIGITGTKGKSTTTKLCLEILRAGGHKVEIAGNIGSPLLDHFQNFFRNKVDWIVVELSSYQLENLRVSPGIAIFLSFYRDHINRHGTMHKYFTAKQNLWRFQKTGDLLIVPAIWRKQIAKTLPVHHGTLVTTRPLVANIFPKKSIFRAKHFLEDFGALLPIAHFFQVPKRVLRETLRSFRGLPHRLELFATIRGVRYYDDSISVNPDATIHAVRFFDRDLGTIILGGQDRDQKFGPLLKLLSRLRANLIVTKSETSEKIVLAARKAKSKRILVVDDIPEAARLATLITPKGKVCLLSPAAASYDHYKNFEEKGDLFQKSVKKYAQN